MPHPKPHFDSSSSPISSYVIARAAMATLVLATAANSIASLGYGIFRTGDIQSIGPFFRENAPWAAGFAFGVTTLGVAFGMNYQKKDDFFRAAHSHTAVPHAHFQLKQSAKFNKILRKAVIAGALVGLTESVYQCSAQQVDKTPAKHVSTSHIPVTKP